MPATARKPSIAHESFSSSVTRSGQCVLIASMNGACNAICRNTAILARTRRTLRVTLAAKSAADAVHVSRTVVATSGVVSDLKVGQRPCGWSKDTYCGYDIDMPWTAEDAERHTHKATTPELKELWAKVANESLERDGDEGRAIREANAVIARQA